jgi:hypothetical protein
MKITYVPPGPEPKKFTAMTPALVNAMRFAKDLTIDQRTFVWPPRSEDIEGNLLELVRKKK